MCEDLHALCVHVAEKDGSESDLNSDFECMLHFQLH